MPAPTDATLEGPKGAAPKVALVIKRSAYRVWIAERNDPRYRALLERDDANGVSLRASHEAHEAAVSAVKLALDEAGADVALVRESADPFDAEGFDLVVTVGGDGTFLSASHSVGKTPILGINSNPERSVGFFCAADARRAREVLLAALRGELPVTVLTRMRVTLNGAICHARVLNDALFCHASPAATTRYVLRVDGRDAETGAAEEQKSSGFWIGPAAGSTAAQRSAGGRVLPLTSERLQLVVREPYLPLGRAYRLARVLLAPGETLVVTSKTHEGRLFVDGPNRVSEVGYGDVVTFARAPEPLRLLGTPARRELRPR